VGTPEKASGRRRPRRRWSGPQTARARQNTCTIQSSLERRAQRAHSRTFLPGLRGKIGAGCRGPAEGTRWCVRWKAGPPRQPSPVFHGCGPAALMSYMMEDESECLTGGGGGWAGCEADGPARWHGPPGPHRRAPGMLGNPIGQSSSVVSRNRCPPALRGLPPTSAAGTGSVIRLR